MATEAKSTGHLGNLTADQEDGLRKFWVAIGKICGHPEALAYTEPATKVPSATSQPPESPTTKRRFSLLGRWRSNDSQEAAEPEKKDASDENDKHGQGKLYQKAIASQSPESIRKTLWDMIHHDHPDAIALRFLRARKWDVQKAVIMLIATVNWRQTVMHVDDDIMVKGEIGAVKDEKDDSATTQKLSSDFMAQSRMGKCFLHGVDKEGRPLCVVRVRLHKPGAQSNESLERYTVYIIETVRMMLDNPIETATVVFDMTGFTLANMDYHPVKFIIQCFEANYPECLGAILIHNAPWIFQGIWKIIRGWLDPVVANKVHFTNYRAGLEEFIDTDKIIKELEGDEDWEYKYDEPNGDEDHLMKDTQKRDELLATRKQLYSDFENATFHWVKDPESEEGQKAKAERQEIAEKMRIGYWEIDPYVRSRSLYDRRGQVVVGGGADWYLNKNVPKTVPVASKTEGSIAKSNGITEEKIENVATEPTTNNVEVPVAAAVSG